MTEKRRKFSFAELAAELGVTLTQELHGLGALEVLIARTQPGSAHAAMFERVDRDCRRHIEVLAEARKLLDELAPYEKDVMHLVDICKTPLEDRRRSA